MIFLLFASLLAWPADPPMIPAGPAPTSLSELEPSPAELLPASFEATSSLSGFRGSKVLIVVAQYAAEPLSAQIARLQSDIVLAGWTVETMVMEGGTAADLRALFQSEDDLDGAILLGHLPCAWFEEDYWGHEEFPCELFLMDLDGNWTDVDGDGLYDGHSGDVTPEIWLGRIDAHAAPGPELMMLASYLEKNHLYRTGAMGLSGRALAFNDDDWSNYSDCGLNSIYGSSNVTVINSGSQTTATEYIAQLDQGYEFVHLTSHSCPWGHTFKVPGGMAGTVMAPEISQVNPRTAFLQLFSCSNARWVEEGCLGNWYLFGTEYGLLVTGAAKTGSMLDFEEYYQPVSTGMNFGEAFREWWEYQAQGGFSAYERSWFYGNALLGDPTLVPLAGGGMGAEMFLSGTDAGSLKLSTSSYSDCYPAAGSRSDPSVQTVVAWLSGENGRLDIAARVYDESTGWGSVIYVDPDEYWDAGVDVCYHDTSPWIVWSDFEYSTYSYRIKSACGAGFSQVEVQVEQEGYQVDPALSSDGSVLWMTWLDWDAAGGAVMIKGIDGAYSVQQLSDEEAWCRNPDICVDQAGNVRVVWEERDSQGSRIMGCLGGTSGFSQPQQISQATVSHSPGLYRFDEDSLLYLTWIDEVSGSDIMLSTLSGSQWSDPSSMISVFSRLSGLTMADLPQPMGISLMWQQGLSPVIKALSLSGGGAVEPIAFGGPAWSPSCTEDLAVWAGDQGDGWNIYCQPLWELGTAEDEIPMNPSSPRITGNPVRCVLEITLPDDAAAISSSAVVFDVSGRMVLRRRLELSPGGSAALDCSNLPSGVYTLLIEQGGATERFTLLE